MKQTGNNWVEKYRSRLFSNKWLSLVLLFMTCLFFLLQFANELADLLSKEAVKSEEKYAFKPFIKSSKEVHLEGVNLKVRYTEDFNGIIEDMTRGLFKKGVDGIGHEPTGAGYFCNNWGIGVKDESMDLAAETVRKHIMRTPQFVNLASPRDLPIFNIAPETTHSDVIVFLCSFRVGPENFE